MTTVRTDRLRVLGVPLDDYDLDGLLDTYDAGSLVFHNLDTLFKAHHDRAFREACGRADYAMVDGQVLAWLLRLVWRRPVRKGSGSDFLPAYCERHRDDPDVTLYLLGAGPGVAEAAGRVLNERVGRRLVVGAHSPSYSLLDDDAESHDVVAGINASGATMLAVALGAPKQELWIERHRPALVHVRRAVAVGATLDFVAGRVRRAPPWVSTLGLEWAYRLVQEPRRLWRRYLWEGPQLAAAVIKERINRPAGDPPHA